MELLIKVWNTTLGKVLIGSLLGFGLGMVILPSISRVYSSQEFLEKELQAKYEQSLSEKESLFKQEQERHQKELSEIKNESSFKEQQFKHKIDTLTSEVSSLRKNVFTETIEIRKPDGTVEKRKTTHSTLETINQKVAEVKEESEKLLKEELKKQQEKHEKDLFELSSVYQMELDQMKVKISTVEEREKKSKSEYENKIANLRRFGVGAGYSTEHEYVVSGHYYFTSALFLGAGVDYGREDRKVSASAVIGVGF